MSTKIYRAWRFPVRQINVFVEILDGMMFRKVLGRIKDLMKAVRPDYAAKRAKELYGKFSEEGDKAKRKRLARYATFDVVINKAREASNHDGRDPLFDLDCSFNLWIHGRYAYVIPYGEEWIMQGICRLPMWAEDYSYWNNTDPPEGMQSGAGYRRWIARSRTWDKVCLGNWNATRLLHEVVCLKKGEAAASMARIQMALFPLKKERR